MNPIKVIIVDDSATMRSLIRSVLEADAGIEVVGEAKDASDARQKIKDFDPDVVTLDVEMPGINGLEFLDKIMRLRPLPVIMISTLTGPGAEAAVTALAHGAFDCLGKQSCGGEDDFAMLPKLVRQAALAKRRISQRQPHPLQTSSSASVAAPLQRKASWPDLVAIGASTGGVEALLTVLAGFPEDCPPTVIVQHMPKTFTASFASRLNRACKAVVTEAADGDPLTAGRVYLAAGGRHLLVKKSGFPRCVYRDHETVQGHRPSVDVLFASVAEQFGKSATGVLLTGMGRDGASGLLSIRRAGGRTLAQDEDTSLVYGMPRAAREMGAVDRGTSLAKVANEVFM